MEEAEYERSWQQKAQKALRKHAYRGQNNTYAVGKFRDWRWWDGLGAGDGSWVSWKNWLQSDRLHSCWKLIGKELNPAVVWRAVLLVLSTIYGPRRGNPLRGGIVTFYSSLWFEGEKRWERQVLKLLYCENGFDISRSCLEKAKSLTILRARWGSLSGFSTIYSLKSPEEIWKVWSFFSLKEALLFIERVLHFLCTLPIVAMC